MEERTVDDDIGKTIVVKKKKDGNIELDDGAEAEEDVQSLKADLESEARRGGRSSVRYPARTRG